MDPLRALFDLFHLGARIAELRAHIRLAIRNGMTAAVLLSIAVTAGIIAFFFLIFAAYHAILPYLGPVYTALVVAAVLLLVAGICFARALSVFKPKPQPIVVAAPVKPAEEMSTSALLALISGIVVGTALHAKAKVKDRA